MAALVHDESADCALKALLVQPPEEVLAVGAESGLLEEAGDELVCSRLDSLVCVGVRIWDPLYSLDFVDILLAQGSPTHKCFPLDALR